MKEWATYLKMANYFFVRIFRCAACGKREAI